MSAFWKNKAVEQKKIYLGREVIIFWIQSVLWRKPTYKGEEERWLESDWRSWLPNCDAGGVWGFTAQTTFAKH